MPDQELTVAEKRGTETLKAFLDSDDMREAIAAALPEGAFSAERFLRIAHVSRTQTPDLAKCTQSSVAACLIDSASMGLMPGGSLPECYLIPRWNSKTRGMECTLQIDYRALMKLMRRSPEVVGPVHCKAVYEGEHFEYREGTSPQIDHRPRRGIARTWDTLEAVYVVVPLAGGYHMQEVMWKDELLDHRERYGQRNKQKELTGICVTAPVAWSKKTVIRRLCNTAPRNVELDKALAADFDGEAPERAEVILSRVEAPSMGVAGAMKQLDESRVGATPAADGKHRQSTGQPASADADSLFDTDDPPEEVH